MSVRRQVLHIIAPQRVESNWERAAVIMGARASGVFEDSLWLPSSLWGLSSHSTPSPGFFGKLGNGLKWYQDEAEAEGTSIMLFTDVFQWYSLRKWRFRDSSNLELREWENGYKTGPEMTRRLSTAVSQCFPFIFDFFRTFFAHLLRSRRLCDKRDYAGSCRSCRGFCQGSCRGFCRDPQVDRIVL